MWTLVFLEGQTPQDHLLEHLENATRLQADLPSGQDLYRNPGLLLTMGDN